MKRIHSVIVLVLAMVMMLAMFSGCKSNDTPNTTGDDANMVTVTWYQGTKELKSEKVAKGSKLTEWTPKDGDKEFVGWYSEASLAQKFDFSKPINEDTDIFASFKSTEYVEDTNNYYVIGSGAGDMSVSGWDHATSEANLSMTKDTSITNKNVYTITLKMYAGDRFQVCHGGGWDGQQGIGYIPGAEYADGTNPNDGKEYTAADKKFAHVKNDDGEVVFIGGDEYDKEFFVWNIILAEGMDGVYKFTYTTTPGNFQFNTLEWELVEKIEPLTTTHEMHIIGSFNEWNAEDTSFPMNKSEDGTYWTGFVTITPEHYVDYAPNPGTAAALKVINHIDGAYYGDADGENFFLTEGTYCIKYTVETNAVEIQALDYYVVGTLLDAEGNAVNFAVKEGVSPKLVDGTVTFEAYDATGNNAFSWMTDQGKPGVMAIKVVFGCELGIKDWFSAPDGDNFYINAGSVTVTLADGVVTVTQ